MDSILVTGGAGFMGSHVVDELIREGNKVVVLDDMSGGFPENVNEKALLVEGSIMDYELVKDLFAKHKFDYVFHLAAYAAEGLSHFIKRFNYSNNLIGSVNLINESVLNNVKCFVFTSSIAVYGKGQLPMKEDMVPVPEDPYGIAKLAVEEDLKATKEMFGMDYIIFRPHNVYGEKQNIGDKYRNVIGIFMNNIMRYRGIARVFITINVIAVHGAIRQDFNGFQPRIVSIRGNIHQKYIAADMNQVRIEILFIRIIIIHILCPGDFSGCTAGGTTHGYGKG